MWRTHKLSRPAFEHLRWGYSRDCDDLMISALFGLASALGLGIADFMGRFSTRDLGAPLAYGGVLLIGAVATTVWFEPLACRSCGRLWAVASRSRMESVSR